MRSEAYGMVLLMDGTLKIGIPMADVYPAQSNIDQAYAERLAHMVINST